MSLEDSREPGCLGVGVSIVICTFDVGRFSNLRESVTLLREQVPTPHEIIIVVNDNASLADLVSESIDGVTIVVNDRPGVSHARDAGVAAATGDVVAFIDDDALPATDWLANLVAPFVRDDVMMTSGWIEPNWVTGRPRWFPEEFLWVVGCSYRGLPANGAVLRNPIGASMAVRRTVITEVGTFESTLGRISTDGNGCEETEYAIRAHRSLPDKVVVQVRDSVAYHLVPGRRSTPSYFLKRCWREGRSKAVLVELTGPHEGLSSERSYVRSTLVRGALGDLLRVSTWSRAVAIASGLLVTAAGFGVGRTRIRFTRSAS